MWLSEEMVMFPLRLSTSLRSIKAYEAMRCWRQVRLLDAREGNAASCAGGPAARFADIRRAQYHYVGSCVRGRC